MLAATDLKGIIPPVVTPVGEGDTPDFEGLRRVVRHVLDGGVHGVFALGGTGNFCNFTAEERFAIARTVVDEVKGRVPVLVGCMDSNTRLVLRNVELAGQAGADAVVVEPPYYYPCTPEDVLSHYRSVTEAARVPVIFYNVPEANKVNIDLPLTRRLAALPGIVGLKDSTGNFVQFQALLSGMAGTEFRLIQGLESLAGPSLLLGAHGAILAIGNVAPALCVELYQAASAGRLEETIRLQEQLMSVFAICSGSQGESGATAGYVGVTVGSFFVGFSAALKLLGICDRVTTAPYPTPSPADYERVRGILVQAGLLSPVA